MIEPCYIRDGVSLCLGDCLDVLSGVESNSIDLLATDPPYGISFLSKEWDTFERREPAKSQVMSWLNTGEAKNTKGMVEFFVPRWRECLRVLKPGAFAFVMCAPRQDVLSKQIVSLSEAGFDTSFTSLYWTYSSGFTKALNVSRRLAKCSDIDRDGSEFKGAYCGYQPKPAVEVIIVAMKPLETRTYTAQALKNGHGVTWLDSGRIPTDKPINVHDAPTGTFAGGEYDRGSIKNYRDNNKGRFPANLLVSDGVLDNDNSYSRYFDLDAWWAKTLPFLVVSKASKSEKERGLTAEPQVLEGRDKGQDSRNVPYKARTTPRINQHPTVKPVKLFSYLISLGSRKGDMVLDPFDGSGTTPLACRLTERECTGIEIKRDYMIISMDRLG